MKQPGFSTKTSHPSEDSLVDSNALSKQNVEARPPTCLCSERRLSSMAKGVISTNPRLNENYSCLTRPLALFPPQHPPKCKMQHKTAYTHLVTPRRYWWPIITTKVSSLAAWKHVVVFTMIYLHATAWLSAPVRQTHDFIEHNHQEDLAEERRLPTPYIVGIYSAWNHNRWALRSNPGSRSSDPVHTWHVHQIPTRLKYIAKVYSLIQTREKSTHAPSPTQVSSKETLGVPMPYLICCVSSFVLKAATAAVNPLYPFFNVLWGGI